MALAFTRQGIESLHELLPHYNSDPRLTRAQGVRYRVDTEIWGFF